MKAWWTALLIVGSGWACCLTALAQGDSEPLESTVVRLLVSKKQADPISPWQFEEVVQQIHLAVVLDDARLLTTSFAVADATFIEAQRFGSSQKIELRVAFVDYEANLALLTPSGADENFAEMRPVVLGEDLAINDTVDIYRARDLYQMSRMPASLQDVGFFTAVTSSYSQATYLLKVQQSGLGWSEPVFRNNRLVAMATGQDNNYVYATPISIIRHFLDDRHEPEAYRGFPAIGIELAALTSPDMRRLLKADHIRHGVRIAKVVQRGFDRLLQENDILLAIDGVEISEHGFYTHAKWGKIHLKYLLNLKYAGDPVRISILRRGEILEIDGQLERYDSNAAPVVAYSFGEPIPHLIFGGLVFQELSRAYLKQWGRDWEDAAPLSLLYTYNFDNEREPGQSRRVIFVSRVLADSFNRGYGDLQQAVVVAVNGKPVTSMDMLHEALRHPIARAGRAYARVEFAYADGEVILAYDGLNDAHRRIAKTYEISTPASFYHSTLR